MKRFLSLFLCIALLCGAAPCVSAAEEVQSTAEYIYKTVPMPTVGSIGGEWAVLGLARSGIEIPKGYYAAYYENLEAYVKEKNGVLHERKYTEYSRVILALTAIGKDPENVAGYDLLLPLADFDKTVWQGINGAVFALLALDSGNYASDLRERYVDYILQKQLPDGGFALSGEIADADVTAMVLQALAGYRNREDVKAAIDKALALLSAKQTEGGGFATYGIETAESAAQVIVPL